MRNVVRAVAVTGVVALALTTSGSAGHASQGNENKSASGAQTQKDGTTVFFDAVPCASDTGYFEITLNYRSTQRFVDEHGHFNESGTFSAVPITPTAFEDEDHDGHVHRHVVAGVPREGNTYSGRYGIHGTFNDAGGATTESFGFRVNGTSSAGESVVAKALFHQTTKDGETRSLVEKESCR